MPRTQVPAIELLDVEKVTLSIAPKDSDGQPVPGPFNWSVTNEVPAAGATGAVVVLQVADDGLSAVAVSGVPGTATVEVMYDMPDTDDELVEAIDITIKTGLPNALNLSAGAPVPE